MAIESGFNAITGVYVHRCIGKLTFEQISQALDAYYSQPNPPARVLWDGRDATLSNLTADQLRMVARYPLELVTSGKQTTGRRAIVVANDLDFGLSRIIDQVVSANEDTFGHVMRVFRSYDEAMAWLNQPDATNP